MGAIREKFFLQREETLLVVIDIQERLCKAMPEKVLERLTGNVAILLAAAGELKLPVITTEQYVKGLGPTLPELAAKLPNAALEKLTFSCCGDPAFLNAVRASGKRQVLVVGMETHVCVLQTVLELLDEGYTVHLVRDAVMSRHKENWQTGLATATAAGAVLTSTEAALFQLLKVAGSDEFRTLSKLVR